MNSATFNVASLRWQKELPMRSGTSGETVPLRLDPKQNGRAVYFSL